jgi:hypothetical protein
LQAKAKLAAVEEKAQQVREQVLRHSPLQLVVLGGGSKDEGRGGSSGDDMLPFVVKLTKGDHEWSVEKTMQDVKDLRKQLLVLARQAGSGSGIGGGDSSGGGGGSGSGTSSGSGSGGGGMRRVGSVLGLAASTASGGNRQSKLQDGLQDGYQDELQELQAELQALLERAADNNEHDWVPFPPFQADDVVISRADAAVYSFLDIERQQQIALAGVGTEQEQQLYQALVLESGLGEALKQEQTHTEQTHAEQTHTEQTHAEQTHTEQTHAEQTHTEQTHTEQTHAEQTHAEQTHAEAPESSAPAPAVLAAGWWEEEEAPPPSTPPSSLGGGGSAPDEIDIHVDEIDIHVGEIHVGEMLLGTEGKAEKEDEKVGKKTAEGDESQEEHEQAQAQEQEQEQEQEQQEQEQEQQRRQQQQQQQGADHNKSDENDEEQPDVPTVTIVGKSSRARRRKSGASSRDLNVSLLEILDQEEAPPLEEEKEQPSLHPTEAEGEGGAGERCAGEVEGAGKELNSNGMEGHRGNSQGGGETPERASSYTEEDNGQNEAQSDAAAALDMVLQVPYSYYTHTPCRSHTHTPYTILIHYAGFICTPPVYLIRR